MSLLIPWSATLTELINDVFPNPFSPIISVIGLSEDSKLNVFCP
jgi:hypothetical protein